MRRRFAEVVIRALQTLLHTHMRVISGHGGIPMYRCTSRASQELNPHSSGPVRGDTPPSGDERMKPSGCPPCPPAVSSCDSPGRSPLAASDI
jgi:hypothetical protein